jgi:hypothetical protein
VLILVIMSGTALLLMTNQARVTETQVRRVTAVDAVESSALAQAYEELRTNTCLQTVPAATCFSGSRTPGNFTTTFIAIPYSLTVTVITRAPGTPPCPGGAPADCVIANVTY